MPNKKPGKTVSSKSKSARASVKPSHPVTVSDAGKKNDTGSKQGRVIALLQSPSGTTIAGMMQETGWQQHSVRGFLAGVIRKKLKLKLDSNKVDGNRVYRIKGEVTPKISKRRSA